MADVWNGTPATWATGEAVLASKMNTEIRDRFDALKAGLVGDSSADADIKQAAKNGLLSARPAASQAGRVYYATDIDAQFIDTGTAWRHTGGSGAFDSFVRTSGDAMGTADSGHAWTEHEGDIDIVSGRIDPMTVAPSATATVDTGAPLRTASYGMTFQVGSVAANLTVSIVLRWADLTNNLYVQCNGAAAQLQIVSNVAGLTDTVRAPESFTFVAGAFYYVEAQVRGPVVVASVRNNPTTIGTTGDNPVGVTHAVLSETYTGSLVTATRAGVRFGTGGAGIGPINDWFAIPNA